MEKDLPSSLPPGWRPPPLVALRAGFVLALAILAATWLNPARVEAVTGPAVTIDSGPQDPTPTSDSTPTFGFTSIDPLASTECRVDSDSFAPCSSPFTTASLADGPHIFEVVATDALGIPGPVATRAFTVDTTAPIATIDAGPQDPMPTSDATPTFALSSTEAGAALECRVDAGSFAPCGSAFTTGQLADGAHTLEVVATDAAGNRGPVASRAFTVDTSAPGLSIDSGPQDPTPTNDPTPTFGFTSADPLATVECRVDSDSFASCSSPFTTHALADGRHRVDVLARDPVGNLGPIAGRSFTVDTVPPDGHITAGPGGPTSDPTPTFSFGGEPGAAFQCAVDGGAYSPCSSPRTIGPLADGSHTFKVAARDAAGNQDPSPAGSTFVVDTGAPETAIISGPPARSTDSTPSFAFVSSQAGSRFECSVDGGAFSPCTSPTTPGPLPVGDHSFAVRARDAVGNVDTSPATLAFTIVEPAVDLPSSADPIAVLATDFAQDLGRLVMKLRTSELPRIVRAGGIRVGEINTLLPGTARIGATTGANRRARRVTVLRGRHRFAVAGKAPMRLKLTTAGRRVIARARRRRMTVTSMFAAELGIRMSASARVTVWRRWLTLAETSRVARRWIPRYFDQRPRSLTLGRCTRRGAVYIRCGRVRWLHRGEWWHVGLRVRETARGLRHRMTDAST